MPLTLDNLAVQKKFGPMTVEIKSQKSRTDATANEAAARAPNLRDILYVDPLQQGQALLAAGKKRKKQQKRAGLYKYRSRSHSFIIDYVYIDTNIRIVNR